MRAYPVIIYTDPATGNLAILQIDDRFGIDIETETFETWTGRQRLKNRITITATTTRTLTGNSTERTIGELASTLGQEIERLKKHAIDEYRRGHRNGKQYALNRMSELIETEADDEEQA
ncbi:hypothetical protein M3C92_09165 [Dermabacter hominis]|uniref:hypothetical protein n=1 Tax=Dermabacter hominis TaxID=36740 RepID=UPI0021A76AB4|nr:hypothetical protein [Dermabacter hominis]MCT1956384.1 hypothetical protein [Dermabacter hominis]